MSLVNPHADVNMLFPVTLTLEHALWRAVYSNAAPIL